MDLVDNYGKHGKIWNLKVSKVVWKFFHIRNSWMFNPIANYVWNIMSHENKYEWAREKRYVGTTPVKSLSLIPQT